MLKNAPHSDKNKKTWTANLMQFQYGKTSRRHTTVECLSQMNKIPKEQHILERYKTLASGVKSKKKRTQILAGEVRQLWKNLTLPIQQGKSTVERKIENVIKQYERHSRRPGNYDFTKLFNVTDEKGEWLCQKDRDFYKLQMSTEGKVGYCSRKEGNKAIHPRKMKSFKRKVTEASVAEEIFNEIQRKFQKVKNLCTKNSFLVVMKILESLQPLKNRKLLLQYV